MGCHLRDCYILSVSVGMLEIEPPASLEAKNQAATLLWAGHVSGNCGQPPAASKKPDAHAYHTKEENSSLFEHPDENTAQVTPWLQPCETLSEGHKKDVPALLYHRKCYAFKFVITYYAAIED